MLELPDVARPVVLLQRAQRADRDPADPLARLAAEGADERLHEGGEVLAPLAQRGHAQRVAGHPVIEVPPEGAVLHPALEVGVGGRHHPDVHRGRRPAHRLHLLLLEGAEELRLKGRRHLPDLVEEQRPALGQLEPPGALRDTRGDALADAEQLGLEEVDGDRGAVDGHERPRLTRGGEVQNAGHALLADARLAEDEDRQVALDERGHLRVERGDRGGVAGDVALGKGEPVPGASRGRDLVEGDDGGLAERRRSRRRRRAGREVDGELRVLGLDPLDAQGHGAEAHLVTRREARRLDASAGQKGAVPAALVRDGLRPSRPTSTAA